MRSTSRVKRMKLRFRQLVHSLDMPLALALVGIVLYVLLVNSQAARLEERIRATASAADVPSERLQQGLHAYPAAPLNEMEMARAGLAHLRRALQHAADALPAFQAADMNFFLREAAWDASVGAPPTGGSNAHERAVGHAARLVHVARGDASASDPALAVPSGSPWPLCAFGGPRACAESAEALTEPRDWASAEASVTHVQRLLYRWAADRTEARRLAYLRSLGRLVVAGVRTVADSSANVTVVAPSGGLVVPVARPQSSCALSAVVAMGARLGAHGGGGDALRLPPGAPSRQGATLLAEALAASCQHLFAASSGPAVWPQWRNGDGDPPAVSRLTRLRAFAELFLLTHDPLYGAWTLGVLARRYGPLSDMPPEDAGRQLAAEIRFPAYLFNAMECKTYPQGRQSRGLCLLNRDSAVFAPDGLLLSLDHKT